MNQTMKSPPLERTKRALACVLALCLSLCMVPAAAFANTGDLVAGNLAAQDGESADALQPVSSLDKPVEATVIDPTEDGATYDLYYQWSDDTEAGMGKYHWDKVTLAVYTDDNGIKYYFVTNPQPEKAASELFCTLVVVPESAQQATLNIPGYVQLVSKAGEGSQAEEVGSVRSVVQIGYSGGSKYKSEKNGVAADQDQNQLDYWYAKDLGNNKYKESISGANNDITRNLGFKTSSILFPKTLQRIGDTAFYQWMNLESVQFEDGCPDMTVIGWRAFQYCSNLESIDIPANVVSLGGPKYHRISVSSNGGIEDYDNENVGKFTTSAVGTEPVASLAERVPTGASEGQVFANCTKLQSIDIPANVKEMGSGVFENCSALTAVNGLGNLQLDYFGKAMFSGCSSLASLMWPSSLTAVPIMTFQNSGLISFEVPASVTSIGSNAFMGTSKLKDIACDSASGSFASDGGILYNKDFTEVVLVPAALERAVIHDGVESVGTLFSQNKTIQCIDLPDSITGLANMSFSNCAALREVKLGAGISSIPRACFANDSSLEKVVISYSGNFSFGPASFMNCNKLGVIEFSGSIKQVSALELPQYLNMQTVFGPTASAKSKSVLFTGDSSDVSFIDNEITGSNIASNANYLNGAAIGKVYVTDLNTASQSLKDWCACGESFKREADKDSDFSKELIEFSKGVLSDLVDVHVDDNVSYTSKEQQVASVTAKNDSALVEGTDFELSYSDNVNAGTAKATVRGLGVYYLCEPLEVEFTIEPADISKAVVAEIPDQTLAVGEDGAAVACKPQVSASITLVEGGEPVELTADDFDVSYTDNALPGTATVTLTGKGNYAGTATATFTIQPTAEQAAAAQAVAGKAAEVAAGTASDADLVAAYGALDDAAKTQVDGKTSAAVVAAQQRIADAAAAEAAQAVEAAEAAQAKADEAAGKSAGEAAAAKKDAETQKQLAEDAAEKAKAAQDKADQLQKDLTAAKGAKANAEQAAKDAKAAQAKAEKDAKDAKAGAAKAAKSSLKKNTMTVKAKTVKAKAKKNTTAKKAKAFTVKKAKGKVTFYKLSGNAKVKVSKAGKVTVKKGLKEGKTYKVKVLVCAKGNKQYAPAFKTVTLKVKVTK